MLLMTLAIEQAPKRYTMGPSYFLNEIFPMMASAAFSEESCQASLHYSLNTVKVGV